MLGTTQEHASFPLPMPSTREVRCLLLDDSSFDRARIRRLSNESDLLLTLDEVDSINGFEESLERGRYELVLIDYRLPIGDGIEALEAVLRSNLNKFAGKIMITGDTSEHAAVEAMRAGCHDFVNKRQMDAGVLHSAMMNALTRSREALFFLGHPPQHVGSDHRDDQTGLHTDRTGRGEEPLSFPTRNIAAEGFDPTEIDKLLSELRFDDNTPLN